MSNTFFNPTSASNGSSLLSRLQNINLNTQNQPNKEMRIKPLNRVVGFPDTQLNDKNEAFDQQNKTPFNRTVPVTNNNQSLHAEFIRRMKSNPNNTPNNKVFNHNSVNALPLDMENPFNPVSSMSSTYPVNTPDQISGYKDDRSKKVEHYYFTDSGIEIIEDLQISGVLKESDWILYPPASVRTAPHLLYGRNDEFKGLNEKQSAYMDQELLKMLRNRLKASMYSLDDKDREKYIHTVGAYCDVVPLEQVLSTPRTSISYSLPSQCYKAWSPKTQKFVCLRRIQMNQSNSSLDSDLIYFAKHLCSFEHPNIISLRDVFMTEEFKDISLILVYDYHPNALTLQSVHMSDPNRINTLNSIFNQNRNKPHSITKGGAMLLSGSIMRSYLVQITCAVQYLHKVVKIPFNLMDPTKILIIESNRIRLNCFGLMAILALKHNEKNNSLNPQEIETDLVNIGNVLLSIGCGTIAVCSNSMKLMALTIFQNYYSKDLFNVTSQLIKGSFKTIDELVYAIAPFSLEFSHKKLSYNDFLKKQILKQLECDRLFRLICKLNTVLERNDPHDPQWSEVDDRFSLKMFRDFVFHQIDDYGSPYLDLSHVVLCLNKLEVGSLETICLVSQDNKTCMIVTYKQVQDWLNSSFNYLVKLNKKSLQDQENMVSNIYAHPSDLMPEGYLESESYQDNFEKRDPEPVLKPPVKDTIVPREVVEMALSKKNLSKNNIDRHSSQS